MSLLELVLIAIGLAMDAFAVSICKGLSLKKMEWNKALLCGVFFGGFQALMPLIGYALGSSFQEMIESVDHWIAFILLSIIGGSMIRDSFNDEDDVKEGFDVKTMVVLAISTSIDALAVGVGFAFLKVNIWTSTAIIGIITFVLSTIGVKVGSAFGSKFKNKAELAGGVILILIGLKILLEHLGILG